MDCVGIRCEGPLGVWIGPLSSWLEQSGCAPGRAQRTVRAFARLSSWMARGGWGVADLDEALIAEHVRAERDRSGSRFPAAFQYLPLATRFLATQGVLVLSDRKSRDRRGVPRSDAGPLTDVLQDLLVWLRSEGYTRGTTVAVTGTAARLGSWMGHGGFGVADMDEVLLEKFLVAQSLGPVCHPSSARRMVTVRKFLIVAGLLDPPPVLVSAPSPATTCLEEWGDYLQFERGVGRGWVAECTNWARAFVERLAAADGRILWSHVDGHMVNAYVATRGRGYSLSSRRHLVVALRSLVRWAFATGRMEQQIAGAILSPPRARPGLPQALTSEQLHALRAAADDRTMLGARDAAIVVMISRLGLRCGEVATLRLEDIDWHHGH